MTWIFAACEKLGARPSQLCCHVLTICTRRYFSKKYICVLCSLKSPICLRIIVLSILLTHFLTRSWTKNFSFLKLIWSLDHPCLVGGNEFLIFSIFFPTNSNIFHVFLKFTYIVYFDTHTLTKCFLCSNIKCTTTVQSTVTVHVTVTIWEEVIISICYKSLIRIKYKPLAQNH